MPNRSTGRNQTKSDPLVPQVRGLGWGLITHSHKKRNITKTESRYNSLNLGCTDGTFPNNGEPMTQGGQSQQEKRKAKNNMVPDCRERKSWGWLEIMGWGERGCCEQEKMERNCWCLMWHLGREGDRYRYSLHYRTTVRNVSFFKIEGSSAKTT